MEAKKKESIEDDIMTMAEYVASHIPDTVVVECRRGKLRVRESLTNPHHLEIYYRLKDHGERQVNILYEIASFMLHQCDEEAEAKRNKGNVLSFCPRGGGVQKPKTL